MEIETIAKPFEVQLGREGDRIVQITIRAADGSELGSEEIRDAIRQILDYTRRQLKPAAQPATSEPDSEATETLVRIARADEGRVTDQYLAALAIAYGELAPRGRNVSVRLAALVDKNLQTVKGHLVRARQEGFLTPSREGREGGKPTEKALQTIKLRVIEHHVSDDA